jgi:fructuronate reductase
MVDRRPDPRARRLETGLHVSRSQLRETSGMRPEPHGQLAPPLSRALLASVDRKRAEPAPARIVHLGLGGFHRAHQAWYTDRASDAASWGIAAFTGRTPDAALRLASQDGLYTLIERAGEGDTASIVGSIVEAVDGANVERLVGLLASASTSLVTITVSEAGYRLAQDGLPDPADELLTADLGAIAAATRRPELLAATDARPRTALGRLLLGLEARRRADAGPIAIVPCDNVPDNGGLVATGLRAMAAETDAALAGWIDRNVAFVSTSVDRITPRTTREDLVAAVELTGWHDAVPVVTEPFSDWLLCGEFPAGRPAWESAGARFVDDIEPFERRKLWLLNGAHSLLAYAGLSRGHETVAGARGDPQCVRFVEAYWDEATPHLPPGLAIEAYRSALLERFSNPRIEYRLRQIATDGVAKLRVRIAPVVLAERAAGRDARASLRAIGAWLALALGGAHLPDTESAAIDAALALPGRAAIDQLVRLVEPRLLDDELVMASLLRSSSDLTVSHE